MNQAGALLTPVNFAKRRRYAVLEKKATPGSPLK